MNKWRPDNWSVIDIAKPIKTKEPIGTWVSQLDVDLVEAGADAILEALKKAGIGYSKDYHQLLSYPPQGKTGWLVFIEDKE